MEFSLMSFYSLKSIEIDVVLLFFFWSMNFYLYVSGFWSGFMNYISDF